MAGLSSLDGETDIAFKYDADGLRVRKEVNGEALWYTLAGNRIVRILGQGKDVVFLYDASGRPALLQHNTVSYNGNSEFLYVYNLQGDVVALLNSSTLTPVVEYFYDAWGKPTGCTGPLANTLGKDNPFRYRGYVYDEETGLYYLRSRYYNPEWGRFVNADALITRNLFAYCANNPVMYFDPDGRSLLGALLGAIAGGVVGAIVGGVVGAAVGAVVGAVIGKAVSGGGSSGGGGSGGGSGSDDSAFPGMYADTGGSDGGNRPKGTQESTTWPIKDKFVLGMMEVTINYYPPQSPIKDFVKPTWSELISGIAVSTVAGFIRPELSVAMAFSYGGGIKIVTEDRLDTIDQATKNNNGLVEVIWNDGGSRTTTLYEWSGMFGEYPNPLNPFKP